ncbi:MAG: hypothetical protein PHS93_07805 [Candidatus Omnitrophica bacterium]|nr:hypothetical protein [Candidatus Omnitrophota bacterium]
MSTPGAMRAAQEIQSYRCFISKDDLEELARIIDEEMHSAEVLEVLQDMIRVVAIIDSCELKDTLTGNEIDNVLESIRKARALIAKLEAL